MARIIWNDTSLLPDSKELLLVNIDDKDLVVADIRKRLVKDLSGLELSIPDTAYILEHQWFLPGCVDPNQLMQYIKTIPGLNKDYLEAVTAVLAYNTKKIAWATSESDFQNNIITSEWYVICWVTYHSYREYILACASVLYDRFNFSATIVGTFAWSERGEWHKVNTPYGTFENWNWNKQVASPWSKVWDIQIENPWFMIWERMRNRVENKACVVIDAWHNHNYKNERSKSIVVLYEDWTTKPEAPRLLERASK